MKLISVNDLKLILDKDEFNDDKLIKMLIEQVSKRFETYLNRLFVSEERTKYFNAGKRHYYLPAYPIDTDTPPVITISDNVQTENSNYYVWEDKGLIEFYSAPTYSLPKQVKIVWTGGWEQDTDTEVVAVPDDLKHACLLQTAFTYKRRGDIGLKANRLGEGTISILPFELLPEVKNILKIYRALPSDE